MTHFNRPHQLGATLDSLNDSRHGDFEVVVVDDCSTSIPLPQRTDYPVHMIQTKDKRWTNPEPAYNLGIQHALTLRPDVIILQNAECYHVGDVIARAAVIEPDEYLTFGCFSLDERTTFRPHDILALVMANDIGATYDGQLAWYNHSHHRPVAYDFCSAITPAALIALNGYDERFSLGWGYGDNYLLERIKMLGLRVGILDTPFVVHQWHYSAPQYHERRALTAKNRALFEKLLTENNPRAEHLFTENLLLTYAEN